MVSSTTDPGQQAGVWSRYTPLTLIGQGVYGKVHKAYNKETTRLVAIKETVSDMDGILPTTLRELAIMKQLKHRNIVQLLEADQCMINNQVFIVMEYCDWDLSRFLSEKYELLVGLEQDFLYQILSGVNAIHSAGLMHRDIKPANILVCEYAGPKYLLKLADFGLSRHAGGVMCCKSPETQTMLYRAPEVFFMVPKVLPVIDIWSTGCVFAEMFRGTPLFVGQRELELVESIFQIVGPVNDQHLLIFQNNFLEIPTTSKKSDMADLVPGLSDTGLDLLENMLDLNPGTRITARYALQHAFFDNFEPETYSEMVHIYKE